MLATTLAAIVLAAAAPADPAPAQAANGPDGLTVRQGYRVSVAIADLRNARFMEFDDQGILYVSRPDAGEIDTFKANPDGTYAKLGVYINHKQSAHGMHFKDGWMWFTTSDAVYKARPADAQGKAADVTTVLSGLPHGGHWWRSIFVTDDGFFTSIGDSGNATDETKTDRQKIWKYTLDGKSRELFCSGIRNTEKLRYRPGTSELWGSDHGSDWFGQKLGDKEHDQPITDLNPPEEFNHYVKDGFYGHPFVVGNRLVRYEFMDRPDIHELAAKTIVPEWSNPAHWAINGWTFIDPAINDKTHALPADASGDVFFAAHGSWNSSSLVGYCIGRIRFDKDPALGGHPCGMEKIVSGLSADGKKIIRPVDCVQAPDGSILFSTDDPGKVYRLTRADAAQN